MSVPFPGENTSDVLSASIDGFDDDLGIPDDRITSDRELSLSGLATANALVGIMRDGVYVGETTAASDGSWTFADPSVLEPASYSYVAQALVGGTFSFLSAPLTIEVRALPTVTIGLVDDTGTLGDDITTDHTPTIGGTAPAGAAVAIRRNGEEWTSAIADENGNWSVEDTVDGAGIIAYVASAPDLYGLEGTSETLSITVFDAPTIDGFDDDTGDQGDGITTDTTPTLFGTAHGADSVRVLRAGEELGTAPVDGDGTWSFEVPELDVTFSSRHYKVEAIAGGATIGESNELLLGAVPVPPVAITGIDDDTGTPGDGVTTDTTPAILGTAPGGNEVYIDRDGAPWTQVTADGGGTWSVEDTVDGAGTHSYSARTVDQYGNEGTSNTLTVVTLAQPTIDDFADDTGDDDDVTTDTTPLLSGTAQGASHVRVLQNGDLIGTAPVAGDGSWTFEVPDVGPISFAVDRHFEVEGVTAEDTVYGESEPFFIQFVLPPPVAIAGFTLDTGTPLDGITTVDTPVFYGTAEPFELVTVSIDGGAIEGGVMSDAEGDWEFPATLEGGAHTVVARVGPDTNGHVGTSETLSLTIFDPPTIDGFTEDTGTPGDGASTDLTPTLSGTAPGATTVEVYRSSMLVGTASVDGNGAWQFTDTLLPPTGPTVVHYYAVGRDGDAHEIDQTAPFSFLLVPAASVTIDGFISDTGTLGDGLTGDTTPSLFGSAVAGSIVAITGPSVGAVTVESGFWYYDTTFPLLPGTHEFHASMFGLDGTEVFSEPFTFTIVAAPTITGFTENTGRLDDTATTDTTPTFAGTADGATTVQILRGGTAVGTASVDAEGAWTFTDTLSVPTSPTIYSYFAASLDAGGGELARSDSFTIDLVPAGAASITGFDEDTGTLGDGITTDRTPSLFGTAAGATIVGIQGPNGGTATVQSDGTWRFDETTLDPGTHQYKAYLLAYDGTMVESATFAITVLEKPVATVDSFQDDTGDLGDGYTQDTTPTIHGTATPGAYLIVSRNGDQIADFTVDGSGSWSVTDTELTPGGYGYSAQAFADGEGGDQATPLSVTVLPTTTVAITAFDENTGSTEDDATTDPTPTLYGISTPDTVVEILRDGVSQGTTAADAAGDWSFAEDDTLAPGAYTYSADASIGFGHDPVTDTRTITIVAEPTGAVTGFTDDTGTLGDGRTVDDTPTVFGTATPGALVIVLRNGDEIAQLTADGAGEWTLGESGPLAPDSYTYAIALVADGFGHFAYGPFPEVEIEILAAPLATVTGFSTDTGALGDNVTTDRTLTLSGTGAPSAYVTVYRGEASAGTAGTDAQGNWTLIDSTVLDPGVHSYSARSTAGGETGPASTTLSITVIPPQAAVTGFSTDTGTLGDRITSDTTLLLSGTSEGAAYVRVYRDGGGGFTAGVDGAGAWSVNDFTTLAPDTYSYQVEATSALGLTGPLSDAFEITVVGAPAAAVTGIEADTGTDGDGITTDTTLTVSGTATALATIEIYRDDSLVGSAGADGDGEWSFADPATLALGDHTYQARATSAGETGALSNDFDVEIVEAPTSVIDTVADDTGTPGDRITTDNVDLVLTGRGSAGDAVTLLRDGVSQGTAIVGGNGTWAITDADTLAAGEYDYTAEIADDAGHEATSATFTVTIVGAPSASVTAFASDTGNQDDGKTSDTSLTVSGTATALATVRVFRDGSEIGTTTAATGGSWSFADPLSLTVGEYDYTATAADAYGHASASSSALTVEVVALPTAAVTGFASDTGTLGDQTTSDRVLTISGTATAFSTVHVTRGENEIGTTTASGDGLWTFDDPTTLVFGTHTYRAAAVDANGEHGNPSQSFLVTVVAPPTTAVTGFADDTGVQGDGTTSDRTLTISGTTEGSATVRLYLGDALVGTVTAAPDGTWSLADSTTTLGARHYSAEATSTAGEIGLRSDALAVTVVDPTATVTGFASDTGTPGDGVTTDRTLTVSGTAAALSIVHVHRDGVEIGTAAAGANGVWSFADPTTLALGPHAYRAQAEGDDQGLGPLSDPLDLRIVAPPPAPAVTAFSEDTGTLGDGVTTDRTLTVSGTAGAAMRVHVIRDGVEIGTTMAAANGTWSFASPTTLAPGAHAFRAQSDDGLGHLGSPSPELGVLVVDATAGAGGGADLLIGTAAANAIQGLEGNDTILGEGGNDTLRGLNGNDSLLGGDGLDRLEGGSGADTARGGGGNDSVYGENGNDRLYGDAGNDRIEAGAGADLADGGAGADTLYGGADNDSLFGDLGADFLFGDAGGDRIHVGDDAVRDSVIGTLAQLVDDTIEGFLADSLAGAAIASDADVVFALGMTNAQRAQIDGDLLDAQGRLFLPGGGALTFLGHAGAEVDAVFASGGVQIWLI